MDVVSQRLQRTYFNIDDGGTGVFFSWKLGDLALNRVATVA